jgi:hypothetical protein
MHAHFFIHASFNRIVKVFTVTRMTAAGVGPKSSGMVLFVGSFLKKYLSLGVSQYDRKGPVQETLAVSFELFHDADGGVSGVDEDDFFHYYPNTQPVG